MRASISPSRRSFLGGAAASAAAFTTMRPGLVRGTEANSAVEIGLIGCGGRGSWIADLFRKSGKYRIVAAADYFPDRVEPFGESFGVPADRRYSTLSGYRRLLDSKLDAVVIETPPYFHPEQAAAAVDAGRHVYCAKPIAVDVPGCLSIADSGKRATGKKLVFLVDFQTRVNPFYVEAVRRVHEGAIGRLISSQSAYLWDASVHDRAADTPEDRLRYWYNSRALGGDVIVEQDIHTLDVATWITGADPLLAFGWTGRRARKHGEINDHFAVTYVFPDNVVVNFLSQKAVPGAPDEIRCRFFGTDGFIDTRYGGDVAIAGKHPYAGGNTGPIYAQGAVANIEAFYDRIATGDCSNPTVAPSVRSNLTCVLGRTAAYAQHEVTWKQLLDGGEAFRYDFAGLKA
ncbi:Gfo/Idh/MocA family protein [Aquisphaera insulae]|uniref:Gfo/Idh/MocA family protein n=1 Tax=Aquisphaera insulae TaxID=2712864 RepID=UPI0013EC2666|nr:Gfo/Idh/MocA family oxidoreductase [Aquisphaera insulae]